MVVAPLHELPCGSLLRGAGPMIQYTLDLKQDCSRPFEVTRSVVYQKMLGSVVILQDLKADMTRRCVSF